MYASRSDVGVEVTEKQKSNELYTHVSMNVIGEPEKKKLKLVTSVSNYTVHELHFVNNNGLVCSTEAPTICFWFNLLRLLIRGHTTWLEGPRRERDAIVDFFFEVKSFLLIKLKITQILPVSIG